MAFNTNSNNTEATTESNLVTQKGYVEDINGKTFTAILFDEDGEAEFRAKIPKKGKISLHIGKILNFSVDKSSEMVADFYEPDNVAIPKLEARIQTIDLLDTDISVDTVVAHVTRASLPSYQIEPFGRRRNYGRLVSTAYETSSSDKIGIARIEKVEGGRIFVDNSR